MDEKIASRQLDASNTENTERVEVEPVYLTGWRLYSITFWLLLSLFVVQMDTSITSTSILTITDHLGSFERASWVFTAYMLPFCGNALFVSVVNIWF
jgi:hypothetical protein